MQFAVISLLVGIVSSSCRFSVDESGQPITVDKEPHMINDIGLCSEYLNKMGCCDKNNDVQQLENYASIDGVFGSAGGGCDYCGVNLKRLWCEYACSPRQSDFIHVEPQFKPMPNPDRPGEIILAQMVTVTVYADTANDLFQSCKRVSFVEAVSAMNSAAGFLSFQGREAVGKSFQYISFNYSYSPADSLFFNDSNPEPEGKALTACNTYLNVPQKLHGFDVNATCQCNVCEQSCDTKSGFIYSDASLLEGFNYVLVGCVYLAVVVILVFMAVRRRRRQKIQGSQIPQTNSYYQVEG